MIFAPWGSRRFVLSVLLLTLPCLIPQLATADPIHIDSGEISGVAVDEVAGMRVYRGIPFAAPPVGGLRWRPPESVATWEGVRACATFGAVSHQGDRLARMMGETLPETSEDCLYLNVWTTVSGTNSKLPVMVWIHGGGLNNGWSNQAMYDGKALAKRGVVFVSVNYRLGPLGFFTHPLLSKESPRGASGNYGILDQIAALEWVKRNIAAFGGDPGNVTIFGESAGGTSIHALMTTPLSKGLFHRAIAESAWVTGTNSVHLTRATPYRQSGEADGEEFAAKLLGEGAKVSLEALRKATPEELLAVAGDFYNVALTVEGWVFPEFPEDIFSKGTQHDVPLMAGTNADEGTMFAPLLQIRSAEDFERTVRKEHGRGAEVVLAVYPTGDDAQLRNSIAKYIGDTWFIRPTRHMMRGMEKVSSKGYLYHFTRRGMLLPGLGAHHGAEIAYVFNTLDKERMKAPDEALAGAMISYWVRFAQTGDPNDGTHPVWPSYDSESDRHLELGEEIRESLHLRKETCDALDLAEARMEDEHSNTD